MTWKHFLLFILCLCHILTNGWTIERDKKTRMHEKWLEKCKLKAVINETPNYRVSSRCYRESGDNRQTVDLSGLPSIKSVNFILPETFRQSSIRSRRSTKKKITGPPAKMAEIGHYDNFQSLDCRLVYKSIGLWPVVEMWQRHVYTNYMLWYFVIICSTDHVIPVFVNAIEDEDNNGSVISITLKGANKVPLPMP